jgi:tRNA-dihydrouridine synthase A
MEYTNCHQRYLFRLISKKSVLYTEMVVANALVRSENKERLLEANFAEEEPLVLQLGGSDPNDMKLAVKIASNYGYKQFNINCGCPSEKVAGAGCFGAALMLQPELVSSLALAVYETSGKSATIKCRLGVDDQDSYEQLSSFINMVSARGNVKHFIVHARKAILNQNFSPHENRNIPKLKYDYVYKLVNDFPNLSFTINGGITNYTQIQDHFSNGVKGVMVGRSVINEPFYWNEIDHTIYDTKDANSLNRREILFKYCEYADYIESSQGSRARRALLKPVLGLFFGEKNSKLFKSQLDFLIKDPSMKVGSDVILKSLACLSSDVLDAPRPSKKIGDANQAAVTKENL